jgi:D-threo-aldose 1-dehydrogenase
VFDPQALGRLGYGAANVGNLYRAITDAQAWAVLDAAWDSGIRYFDTAPHYGLGLSERRLGAFLATKPRREFTISTKVGRLLRPNPDGAGRLDDENDFAVPADLQRVWDFSADGLRRSIEESLTRLGLDSVDIVYLHDPERHDLALGLSSLPALAGLRDEGLVSAVGVGSMVTEALLACVRSGVLDLLMVAGRFTLADQSASDLVLPECRAQGVCVVGAAVLNSGLLACAMPTDEARFDYAPVPADVLVRVRRVACVCSEYGVSLPTAALHYPFQDPAVTSIVVGGADPDQVRHNAAALDEPVPAELWDALRGEGLVA